MKFRLLHPHEREVVRQISRDYGLNVDTVLKEKRLMMPSNGRKEVFITNKQTANITDKMLKKPYFVGLFIGEIKRKTFELGLEGANLISSVTKKKITVNEKTEQLVLYGRDVFSNSVISGKNVKIGDKCLITNRYGEALALGKVKNHALIQNIKDRGWYLRKGK